MHKWQLIEDTEGVFGTTYRMEVPGGWIYRYSLEVATESQTMVFVPRPRNYQQEHFGIR